MRASSRGKTGSFKELGRVVDSWGRAIMEGKKGGKREGYRILSPERGGSLKERRSKKRS